MAGAELQICGDARRAIGLVNIYFSGCCGAGKTTAARYLAEHYGYTLISEGTKVRRVADLLKLDRKDRTVLQTIGEGFRDIFGPSFWVREAVPSEGGPFALDDVRHPSDALWLNERGWVGVRIETEPVVRRSRLVERDGPGVDLKATERESEHLLDKWEFEYRVNNSMWVEAMYGHLDDLMRGLGVEKREVQQQEDRG